MLDKEYTLLYLPLFEQDMVEARDYITNVLLNPEAALNLINETDKAIQKRLLNPRAFQPYRSAKDRKQVYHRINVKNFVVFYVVIGNVMEVRRFIYSRRDLTKII